MSGQDEFVIIGEEQVTIHYKESKVYGHPLLVHA